MNPPDLPAAALLQAAEPTLASRQDDVECIALQLQQHQQHSNMPVMVTAKLLRTSQSPPSADPVSHPLEGNRATGRARLVSRKTRT